MLGFLDSWRFDPVSSVVTLLLAPVAIYLAFVTRRFLKDAIKYIADGFIYALNKTLVHRAAASLTLKRYCRLQLAGPSRYLHVPASLEISLDIDKVFVPLILENPGMNAIYDSQAVLGAGGRIRIIGDPGSGKSSAAKRLFRNECIEATLRPARTRFPILLELRTLDIPRNISSSKLGEWLLSHLKQQAAKYDVYDLDRCFDAYASKSGLLVVLDGLDEVSSTAYPRIELAINDLSRRLRELSDTNVLIVTMRTQFHHQVKADFQEALPIVLSVKRFTPSDIYEFLIRWPFAQDKMENVVRIYNDLTDRPTLREMCTNPLVLSMYVAQDQTSGYKIAPDSRSEFYTKVVDELLIKRRAKQIGAADAQAVVRDQRQRILGQLACRHLLDSTQSPNLLSWQEALKTVMAILHSDDEKRAGAYLRELAKETGLITEEQEGETFRFIHLTFCEFFCAFESVHGARDGWAALVGAHKCFLGEAASRSRLVEVLPFAAALLPRHMKPDAINDVASCNDAHLLALAFLETKLYGHQLWTSFVDHSISSLLERSNAEWDSDWLRELHLFLVVASDAERSAIVIPNISKPDGVAIFFQDFAVKSSGAISDLVKNYAEHDAAAAFRVATLCGIDMLQNIPEIVIESSSQPPFVAVALERAAREPQNAELWGTLFAEAGLRSAVSAVSLAARSERPWKEKASHLSREKSWEFSPHIEPSFYTDCIAIGLSTISDPKVTPLLHALKSIPGPNEIRSHALVSRFVAKCGGLLLLIFYFGGPIYALSTRPTMGPHAILAMGLSLICFFGVVVVARYALRRAEIYQMIANIPEGGQWFLARFVDLALSTLTFGRWLRRHHSKRESLRIGFLRHRTFVDAARRFLSTRERIAGRNVELNVGAD